jgi:hypothetical protein
MKVKTRMIKNKKRNTVVLKNKMIHKKTKCLGLLKRIQKF